jgi:phosphoribosylamine---glycine ligase
LERRSSGTSSIFKNHFERTSHVSHVLHVYRRGSLKVLVIGSGGREHTIAWKFTKSKRLSGLFIAPGNAGTAAIGENNPDLDIHNPEEVIRYCREKQVNFAFIGPEDPLAEGLADALREEGISTVGPHREAAQLESSKAFSKDFMKSYNIPTAASKEFSDFGTFSEYLSSQKNQVVLKKSGLAAGKGVLESSDREVQLEFGKKVLKNDTLLVEERLRGWEISIFALTDGKNFSLLPPSADFKKAEEGDKGLNTGGMGAICPVPAVNSPLMEQILKEIITPTFKGVQDAGLQYAGILYFGLMITPEGPKVLEYNVRLGDPETQVVLPLLKSDIGDIVDAMVHGNLDNIPIRISDDAALGVVVASAGYPGKYKKGVTVTKIPDQKEANSLVFHASTQIDARGRVLTGGGRCFTAVGLSPDILEAQARAYKTAEDITFNGAWFRRDIGNKFFADEE